MLVHGLTAVEGGTGFAEELPEQRPEGLDQLGLLVGQCTYI